MSEVFVSTDARRACRHGVIGSTMGAYPRGTGSNPIKGNGHFFPSFRQLYLSSFSDTHTRVRSGYGKSGKSMEFVFLISKPGKSMEFCEKLWKFRKGVWNFLPSTPEKKKIEEPKCLPHDLKSRSKG